MDIRLEELIKNPLVYYIYQSGSSIYEAANSTKEYIVITSDDFQKPENNELSCSFITMNKWFEKVLNCDIIAWECACLNKKYILKEHVKLLLETDPLKLRVNFQPLLYIANSSLLLDFSHLPYDLAKESAFNCIKNAEFGNQILDNHKIVNYKIVGQYYDKIMECISKEELSDVYGELTKKVVEPFLKQTQNTFDAYRRKELLKNV